MEERYSFKQAGGYFGTLFTCYLVALLVSLVGWLPYVNVASALATTLVLFIIFVTLHKLVKFSPETRWRQTSGAARALAFLVFVFSTVAYGIAFSSMPGIITHGQVDVHTENFNLFAMLALFAAVLLCYQIFVMVRMSIFAGERLASKKMIARTRHVANSFIVLLVVTLLLAISVIIWDAFNPVIELDSPLFSEPRGGVIIFLIVAYGLLCLYCYVVFLTMLKMTGAKMSTATRNVSRKIPDQAQV